MPKIVDAKASKLVIALLAVGSLTLPPARVASAPRADEARRWKIEVLPVLETPFGTLVNVKGRDMNERGQVAGEVDNGRFPSAAFRYTPGVGMEDLDPKGRYRSETAIRAAINEHGDVFGVELNLSLRGTSVFVYRDQGGFDFLKKGRTKAIRRTFHMFGGQMFLPDAGFFCGTARLPHPTEGTTVRPYLYVPGEGWTDLSSVHPRFRGERGAWCKYMTQKGDLVFAIDGPPEPGAPGSFGTQETFVLADGIVHQLPTFGQRVNVTNPPNEAALHPGGYVDELGNQRAYLWSPERGAIRLQPEGEESFALQVNERSLVVGVMGPPNAADRVFTYTEEKGLRVVIDRRDLERLLAPYGLEVLRVYVTDVNNQGAFVGEVFFDRGLGVGFPFYYSPRTGLVDLKAVIDRFDVDFRPIRGAAVSVVEINDRDDILMVAEGSKPRRRDSTAILSLRRD